jgi:hypothetical protein
MVEEHKTRTRMTRRDEVGLKSSDVGQQGAICTYSSGAIFSADRRGATRARTGPWR